jgi:NDP-sugar pyrophosphorylase family protein
MQIIIPMSGFGERFRRAGYSVPKPLINMEGKPIIAHVIDMFPGESDFLFICNANHLEHSDYRMEAEIKKYCPTGRIIGIQPHKLGPVHAVKQVEQHVDLTCYWDWSHFKSFVRETKCSGAIPAYKGFHPHTLGSTNYAYMREKGGWVLDIQEKQPYTENRMEEYASSGTYYFSTGKIMLDAFHDMFEQDLKTGQEFYVSLAYKPLLASNQLVAVYPLQHFMQWGTPEDVAEYNSWSATFQRLAQGGSPEFRVQGSTVIPMAGLGQRFQNEGYSITKPLIPVSGKPMVIQATEDLPVTAHKVFVLRKDMASHQQITEQLEDVFPGCIIKTIPEVTEGQACTAAVGLDALEDIRESAPGPITFGACDNGALYDLDTFMKLIHDPEIDVIVWGVRGHANAVRHPHMYGWINAQNGRIINVSVKTPLKSPNSDPIVLGTFTFRSADNFRLAVDHLIARNGRINGEFYLDSCINDAIELGLNCALFEVDSFISWGTPNDLKTFEYWQSCFHKWPGHRYRMEEDGRIPAEALDELNRRYQATVPELPDER